MMTSVEGAELHSFYGSSRRRIGARLHHVLHIFQEGSGTARSEHAIRDGGCGTGRKTDLQQAGRQGADYRRWQSVWMDRRKLRPADGDTGGLKSPEGRYEPLYSPFARSRKADA